jgi:DNA-binding NarL/FixJ family response regulator
MIIDDHSLIRAGLRAVLEREGKVQIVGEAANGRDAVKLVPELKPEVILMDISMPIMDGIDATHRIRETAPEPRIIGLSYSSRYDHIAAIIKAGAVGYLTKESGTEEIATAIGIVAGGGNYLSPLASSALIKGIASGEIRPITALLPLTPRECEVLKLIAEGNAMKEIAYILKISIKTLGTLRSAVMSKLNIFTVAGLTKFAVRENLVSLEED